MTKDDVLHVLATMTEDKTDDPDTFTPIVRKELFARLFPAAKNAVADSLRGWMNEVLRGLAGEGHVELTRTTVEITKSGMKAAWA